MTELLHPQAAALDLWLGKPAPRYTSYPPAPFFQAQGANKNYHRSLKGLAPDLAIALYVHIPFCQSLCLYCGCNTMITNRADRIQRYLEALKHEIKMVAALIGRRPITSLHFGGGTPNTLAADDMRALFDELRQSFDLSDAHEIAMEIDPRLTSPEQVALLVTCGVTRVSLGVQDFDRDVQTAIHRIQPFELVAKVCQDLRAAGIHHLNFDLIYGLPKQTTETVAHTARLACELKPDRIALFSYAHVPQLKKHQLILESYGIPDSHQRLKLDHIARGILTNAGYESIGIDHFVKPTDNLLKAWRQGDLRRNFQGYTTGSAPLIGLGASSISQTPDGYFQNERDARTYQDIIASDQTAVRRSFLLSPEDRLRGAIIERLMCNLSCDVEEICRDFGVNVDLFAPTFEHLNVYEAAGIIARKGYTLCLTTAHRMAIRVICSLFDDYTHRQSTPASRTA